MSLKYPNTLFNRVNYLKVRVPKQKMKELGQIVRSAYFKKSNAMPTKISMTIINHKGEPSVRSIAVYPDDFVQEMDQLIKTYAQQNKQKRKRIHPKYSPSNPIRKT